MATSTVTCGVITTLQKNNLHPSSSSSTAISAVSLPKLTTVDGCFSTANRRYLTSGTGMSRSHSRSKMEFIVYAGDQIGNLLPFGIHYPDSWPSWLPGVILAGVVPFFTNKWGPFSKFKAELDKVEEAVDNVADRVEDMAEKVEHFVDEIADDLPEDSALRSSLEKVERIADRIGKDAHTVSDLVDKMDEMEAKMEDMFNKTNEENNTPKLSEVKANVKTESTNL